MTDFPESSSSPELIMHHGNCYCQDIEFEFDGPRDINEYDCNCCIRHMKKYLHILIPISHFGLLKGQDKLTQYTRIY